MKRVAEIMYVVEEEREAFLQGVLNPDPETQNIQWICGVRNQQYFELNDQLFMTFEYVGDHFAEDMNRMAAYLDSKGHLIKNRRKDVPIEERETTNWWAPVKKLGSLLETKPVSAGSNDNHEYVALLDGCMSAYDDTNDITYSEEDWI